MRAQTQPLHIALTHRTILKMVVAKSEMGSDVYGAPRLSFPQGLLVPVVLWVNTTLGLGPNVYKQRGPLGTQTTLAALLTTLQISKPTNRKKTLYH